MSQETYAAAVAYQGRGLRVIPIAPNEKIPPKNFKITEFRDRQATDEELKDWFLNHNYNVAALMDASGLLLVDADVYKGSSDALNFVGMISDSTHMLARSPHGGLHYFYRVDQAHNLVTDTQGLLAENVDTKYKGYAVLPPSKIDGLHYEWVEQGEPGPVPALILNKFSVARVQKTELPEKDSLSLISQVIANGFEAGRHNEQLRDLSRLLARVLNTDSEDLKKQAFVEILKALDSKDPTPQQASGNFLPTLKSAWNYESSRISKNPQAVSNPNEMVVDDLSTMAEEFGTYKLKWLVDNWLPENAVLLMAGPPEAGKTWLLLDMAISLAFGNKDRAGFMGHYEVPEKPTPVIVIQQEDFPGQVFARVQTIMQHKLRDSRWNFEETANGWVFDHPAYAPLYFHNHAQLSFDNPESIQSLEQWIKETGAKAVFIDPLYTLGSNENYFADMAANFKELKRLRNTYGTSFVIAHHNRKSGGAGREQVYGSVLINAASEGVILLEKNEDGSVRLSRSGKFFPGSYSCRIDFDIDTDEGRYIVNLGDDDTDAKGKYDFEIMEALQDKSMTWKQLQAYLDIPQATLTRALTRLKDSGKIVIGKGKKYSIGVNTDGF